MLSRFDGWVQWRTRVTSRQAFDDCVIVWPSKEDDGVSGGVVLLGRIEDSLNEKRKILKECSHLWGFDLNTPLVQTSIKSPALMIKLSLMLLQPAHEN